MKFKLQCLYCYCYCFVASVVPDSVQPHRWQPTRLPRPWDSPGKNTGVGCHFLLQCMKVESESEVTQSYPTLSDPMDCSPPGSSIHGIFQARVLEWGAIAFSMSISKVLMKYGHACLFTILYGFFFNWMAVTETTSFSSLDSAAWRTTNHSGIRMQFKSHKYHHTGHLMLVITHVKTRNKESECHISSFQGTRKWWFLWN